MLLWEYIFLFDLHFLLNPTILEAYMQFAENNFCYSTTVWSVLPYLNSSSNLTKVFIWFVHINFFKLGSFFICSIVLSKFFPCTRRKKDIQDQYLDIQLCCDKHFIYLIEISKYSAVISKIFILTYFNISDSEAEYSDITVQYLDIRTEYIRCLSHSWISTFHRVSLN